ncbi:right-handed parallel beta-helix repeat-containing protein [Streptococcus dentasini]
MPIYKRTAAVLMGLAAFGMVWQATTASADEVAESSAPVSDVTVAQPDARATAGQVVSEPASPQTENTQPQASATANTVSNVADSSGYGAQVPYTTYEAENASLANGAKEEYSTDTDSTAVEASYQKYVELPEQGSSVSFQVQNPANAINVRYTIPDGASGQLDVQVNGNSVANLDLSSKSAWQYMDGDIPSDSPSANSRARFRFDEVHTLLNGVQINAGDTLSLVKNRADNVAYGIDFIELEQVGDPIAQGSNAINITSKGAVANDGLDDSQALIDALNEAKSTGRDVYIPEGQFDLARKIGVDASNIKISGAGMWHTKLHFTSDQPSGGGFDFNHNVNKVELSDLYMDSNLTSRYNEQAQYKAIAGSLGSDSSIHDVWLEHFECGLWIGDYDTSGGFKYTDGLVVKNARIRNNLADGVNFAQGTRNSSVINSSIRGNGDDSLATWSSNHSGTDAPATENNKFLNNTIELGWRAGGVGIFGGKGHEVANNIIKDNFAGAGVRLNTVFPGHNFDSNDTGINIHDNYLLNTGTTSDLYGISRGAIDLEAQNGSIKNISVADNKILNSFSEAFKANFQLTEAGSGEDVRFANNTVANTELPQPDHSVVPMPSNPTPEGQPEPEAPVQPSEPNDQADTPANPNPEQSDAPSVPSNGNQSEAPSAPGADQPNAGGQADEAAPSQPSQPENDEKATPDSSETGTTPTPEVPAPGDPAPEMQPESGVPEQPSEPSGQPENSGGTAPVDPEATPQPDLAVPSEQAPGKEIPAQPDDPTLDQPSGSENSSEESGTAPAPAIPKPQVDESTPAVPEIEGTPQAEQAVPSEPAQPNTQLNPEQLSEPSGQPENSEGTAPVDPEVTPESEKTPQAETPTPNEQFQPSGQTNTPAGADQALDPTRDSVTPEQSAEPTDQANGNGQAQVLPDQEGSDSFEVPGTDQPQAGSQAEDPSQGESIPVPNINAVTPDSQTEVANPPASDVVTPAQPTAPANSDAPVPAPAGDNSPLSDPVQGRDPAVNAGAADPEDSNKPSQSSVTPVEAGQPTSPQTPNMSSSPSTAESSDKDTPSNAGGQPNELPQTGDNTKAISVFFVLGFAVIAGLAFLAKQESQI